MIVLPPNDISLVEETINRNDDVAAIILEPTGAHMGLEPIGPTFLSQLRDITYKNEIGDLRHSPSLDLIKKFMKKKSKCYYFDPFVKKINIKQKKVNCLIIHLLVVMLFYIINHNLQTLLI